MASRKPLAAYTEDTESTKSVSLKSDKPSMRLSEWNPRSGYVKPSDRRFLGSPLGLAEWESTGRMPVYRMDTSESESTDAAGKSIKVKTTSYPLTGESVSESTVSTLVDTIRQALAPAAYNLMAEYHACESGTVATFAVSAPSDPSFESDDLVLLSTVGATLESALQAAIDTLRVTMRAPAEDPADTKPGLKRHWDTVVRPSTVKPLARVRAYLLA